MGMDMTAELAPILWGMIDLLFVSALAILAAALPRRADRHVTPVRAARQRQTPRQILSPHVRAHAPASAHS